MSKKAFLARDKKYYSRLGINEKIQVWEDGIRSNGGKGSYEWWYSDAEYEDGTKAVVIFYTKNRFDVKGDSCPTASLEITLPNGEKISREVTDGFGNKINAAKDKCNVQIKNNYIKYVDGNYEIYFKDEDVEYKCTMKSKLPMWRPGTGHFFYGDNEEHFFAWFVAQPSADVEANLLFNGKQISLKGNGYHDHNWGNIEMNKLMHHWYWSRATLGDYTIIACDIVAEKKYGFKKLPVFLVGKDGQILNDNETITKIKRCHTIQHPITKKFMDNVIEFEQKVSSNEMYKIKLNRHEDIIAISLLNNLPKYKQVLIKLLGINPTYVRCVGDVSFEAARDGHREEIHEHALWEQMFFGKNRKIENIR